MEPNQITEIVSMFIKTSRPHLDSISDDLKIVLIRNEEEGYWGLDAFNGSPKKTPKIKLVLDFPRLPEDEEEAMIVLSSFLSQRLSRYFRGVKSNQNRSEKARSDSAKKAINARWRKNKNKIQ